MIEAIALALAVGGLWALLRAGVRAVRGPAAGMRAAARAIALGAVATIAVAVVAFRIADSATFQLFGTIVPRVETDRRIVALTFDDGPTAQYTDSILEALAAADVRATFFLNGASIAAAPELTERIARAGHEIGNHTWNHPYMLLRSVAATRSQIARTDSAIARAGYGGPVHFRPPYGKKLLVLPWVLARQGRLSITWDVAPESYADVAASADAIVAHVHERVRPGSIILLHVMFRDRATSRAAVPGVVRSLRADGYRFVTVSELLEVGGIE